MAVWQGAFSRGVGGVALGLGFLAATAGPAMADTCASIGSNPSLNGPVPYSDILPPFTHTTFDVILAQGDRLTFAWTNLSFPFFEVVILGESEELIETNPEEPSDGSHEYVASKDATFTIRAFGTGGFGGGSQSVTCTPSGGGGGGDDDNGGGGGDVDDNGGGDDDPVTGAARAAAERDALVRGLRSAGPFVSPAGLPGFVRALEPEIDTSVRFRDPGIIIDIEEEIRKSDCAEYQKKLAEARARRDRLSADLASALQELGQLNASLAAGVITEVAYNQAETANRTKRRRIELQLQGLDGAIAELESAVRDCPDMPAGPAGTAAAAAAAQPPAAPSFAAPPAPAAPLTPDERRKLEQELATLEEQRDAIEREVFDVVFGTFIGGAGAPVFAEAEIDEARKLDARIYGIKLRLGLVKPPVPGDPVELGDGEAILFAPQERSPAARVPWPANVSAYAHDGAGRIDASGDHSFMFDGRPALFWTRTRATLLDGSLDRSGVAGSFQAGVVVGVSPVLDVGAFAHVLGGAVKSTALDGEVETIAGGLGGYAKAKLPGGGTLGFSISHEWGVNDITLGGATGSFASSLWTVDADFSAAPLRVDGFVVTPVAGLSWRQIVNGAYVDSNALGVPETRDSTLALSGAIDVARPTYVGGPVVRTMTPRATLRGNWFVKQAETLDLGTLGTIESGALTFDLSGGVAFGLVGGGTLDASLTASGLAGAERGYGLRLGYRAPLP